LEDATHLCGGFSSDVVRAFDAERVSARGKHMRLNTVKERREEAIGSGRGSAWANAGGV
jgi:hypothetical protein